MNFVYFSSFHSFYFPGYSSNVPQTGSSQVIADTANHRIPEAVRAVHHSCRDVIRQRKRRFHQCNREPDYLLAKRPGKVEATDCAGQKPDFAALKF